MRNFKTLVLYTFIVLLLPVSCTIEKRVHRNGYHIEWKQKNHAVPSEESSEKTTSISENERNSLNEISNEDDLSMVRKQNSFTNEIEPTAEVSLQGEEKEKTLDINPVNGDVKPVVKTKSKDNSLNPYNKSDNKRKTGIFMMLVALALLGLAYVFLLYLGVFGLILFWIFGIGAAVYFIIGLVFVIIG